ncbi:MAG: PaaI family thioesterase [Candidatus Hermodarchaeota archaeon]
MNKNKFKKKNINEFELLYNDKELIAIPNMWGGNCFGCSPKNKYGLQMKVYYSEAGCVSRLVVPENYCGFEGLVHGGIIATILDEIAAWTLILHLNRLGVTQTVKIDYLKPVYINQGIIAEGMIKEHKDNFVSTNALIKNQKGDILANCESNWVLPEINTIAKITRKEPKVIEEMLETALIPIKQYNKTKSNKLI